MPSSALALKKKGLRLLYDDDLVARMKFSTGPEEKGIETDAREDYDFVAGSSALALKKKGLRPALGA